MTEETVFEHTIFSNVEDFLEHCRKQLQSFATALFRELDPKISVQIVLFGFDIAKQSAKRVIAAPSNGEVSELFQPYIESLSNLLQDVQSKITNKQTGTVIQIAPMLIQSFIKKIQENVLRDGYSIFSSKPVLRGSFVIFTSLWFRTDDYERHNILGSNGKQVRSLLDSAINQFLQDSFSYKLKELEEPDLMVSSPSTPSYLLRKAGEVLLARIALHFPKEEMDNIQKVADINLRIAILFDDLNTIAKMRHEGADAFGNILICPPDHPNVQLLMEFTTPIWSHSHRQVRKLLEIAQNDIYLLYYRGNFYGFGCKVGSYDHRLETLFDVEIIDHSAWRLIHGEDVLMLVRYEHPSLQVEKKSVYLKRVENALTAQFPSLIANKIGKLQSLVEMAIKQHHGTILVISDHAQDEADRLEKQSVHIKPTSINDDLMKLITAIDGAVLIDTNGICYAIGVILDGIVESGEGDPGRGARYHAALKYLSLANNKQHRCMVVVVSEDGMINMFPRIEDSPKS